MSDLPLNLLQNTDELMMLKAISLARQAEEVNEVPVGAVITHENRIIAQAYNQREILQDPTAHAEILAITQAAAALGNWRLEDTTIYVTLEPCSMCAGALILARVKRLVFGAWDDKAGACGSVLDIPACKKLNHKIDITGGFKAKICAELLSSFFARRRQENKS